ncbi:MAG: hypothetical protein Kow00127_19500 [Bacteroidales bacterium]
MSVSNFYQREQNEGEPATERTEVSVVYDNQVIYFGIRCYDSEPEKILAHQMKRDFRWSSDDNFEVMISTFNDNRNGYLFVTNPNGAMADVWIGNEGEDFNKSWNGVWDVAVQQNSEGWFAEMAIPFSTLKFRKDSLLTWGINFERNIRRKKEQLMWQGWSRLYELEKISQGGKLTGISGVRQGSRIELLPYTAGGIEYRSGEETDTHIRAGGEINLHLSPTLKLNLTLNTDFAQVESDRQQINLSRFSLYYPEKRQFFLEGKNYFDLDVGHAQLFYSRKIGIEDREEVPIIGGGRLFGKINKTNIGVMSIQTTEKDTIPSANFSLVRFRQDLLKQSSAGFMLSQKTTRDGYNRVYGGDITYSTSELFGDKNLITGVSAALSETRLFNSENAPQKTGAFNFFLSYPNDVIEYDLGLTRIEKEFDPQMGFVRRDNYKMLYTEFQLNPRFKKLRYFRNLVFKPIDINYYINDETGETESIFYEWRPLGFVTKSGEFFEFNVQHLYDKPPEDFDLLDTIQIPAGEYWDNRLEVQFESFRGRPVAVELTGSTGEFYTGQRQELGMELNLNVNRHLNLQFDWGRNWLQFPEIELATDEIGGRIDYSFNPKLAGSLFAQWNNEDEAILVNYRINCIPKIGSWFYFVVNQEYSTGSGVIGVRRTTVMAKLIWRFAL